LFSILFRYYEAKYIVFSVFFSKIIIFSESRLLHEWHL